MKLSYLIRKVAHKIYVLMDNDYNLNIMKNGEYNLLKKVIKMDTANSTYFDVGAEKGTWTELLLKHKPDANIHIFEPFAKMQNILINKFKNYPNVKINKVAVGENREISKFNENTYSLHSRESVGRPFDKLIDVNIITLDEYISQNKISEVLFMKMDIEGHEPFALKGAKKSIKKGIFKYIQFEYGACNIDSRTFLLDFYQIFENTNYILGKLHKHHIEYYESYNNLIENFYSCNWVAELK